jgi:hypothetical protein
LFSPFIICNAFVGFIDLVEDCFGGRNAFRTDNTSVEQLRVMLLQRWLKKKVSMLPPSLGHRG